MLPVQSGHSHVANGQVVMRVTGAFQSFAAAEHHIDVVPLVLKNVGNQARDGGFIFNDQHVSVNATSVPVNWFAPGRAKLTRIRGGWYLRSRGNNWRGAQLNGKFCATGGRTYDAHLSTMFADNSENNGKSESSAEPRLPGGKKRIEDSCRYLFRYSRTVIGDLERYSVAAKLPGANANQPIRSGFSDGVASVRKQIDEHLLQFAGIAPNGGSERVQVQFGANGSPSIAIALHFHGLHHHAVHGNFSAMKLFRLPARRQKLAKNFSRAIRFVKNLANLVCWRRDFRAH